MQEFSRTELLEHTSVNQKNCRKMRDLCTSRQEGDQDMAAIVEDKNETSGLEFLLGFSLCLLFFLLLSRFEFFLLPPLHSSFSLQLPEQVPVPFLQGRGGTPAISSCRGKHLLPCPGESSCCWQLKTVSRSPLV